MIKVCFFSSVFTNDECFDLDSSHNRDNFLYFLYNLKMTFRDAGYNLSTHDINTCHESEIIVQLGLDVTTYPSNDQKKYLILLESPHVDTNMFNIALHADFEKIFTWNDDLVDNKKYFHSRLPFGDKVGLKKNIDFDKKKLVMSISGNKFSSNKGDLYSYRRKTINFLNKEFANDFDLYGTGWNDNGLLINIKRFIRHRQFNFTKYQTYRGSPDEKSKVISGYKYCICYENVRYEDFITEKIFDIFINESVPVYYGAKHISEYVPKNTFIDREDFNSDSELMSYLNKIDKNQYMEYIYNINIFLDSEEFRKFGPKYFVENIIKTLGLANND